MKVYVVILEPYHDGSTLCGVFNSLEKAKASCPSQDWYDEGHYITYREDCVLESGEDSDGTYMIYEKEVI